MVTINIDDTIVELTYNKRNVFYMLQFPDVVESSDGIGSCFSRTESNRTEKLWNRTEPNRETFQKVWTEPNRTEKFSVETEPNRTEWI